MVFKIDNHNAKPYQMMIKKPIRNSNPKSFRFAQFASSPLMGEGWDEGEILLLTSPYSLLL